MTARLDREFLLGLYRTYRDDLRWLARFDGQSARLGSAYHKEERRILYMIVRHAAPELIVEFSPKRGLSTAHMALALEHNRRGRILSFELGHRDVRRALTNLRSVGLGHRVEFIFGDVREELPRVLPSRADGLEFVFIDSDHGAAFARWYLGAVVPWVRRGGLIHVHDILTDPLAPRGDLPFPPSGEELEVRRFLAAHREDYEWISVGDCVRDPAYLAAARAFAGGDVAWGSPGWPAGTRGVPAEWNPSLWLVKRADQRSGQWVPTPFEPITRPALGALRFAWRKHRLAATQQRHAAPGNSGGPSAS